MKRQLKTAPHGRGNTTQIPIQNGQQHNRLGSQTGLHERQPSSQILTVTVRGSAILLLYLHSL